MIAEHQRYHNDSHGWFGNHGILQLNTATTTVLVQFAMVSSYPHNRISNADMTISSRKFIMLKIRLVESSLGPKFVDPKVRLVKSFFCAYLLPSRGRRITRLAIDGTLIFVVYSQVCSPFLLVTAQSHCHLTFSMDGLPAQQRIIRLTHLDRTGVNSVHMKARIPYSAVHTTSFVLSITNHFVELGNGQQLIRFPLKSVYLLFEDMADVLESP